MQNDDSELSSLDGLPLYVNDVHKVWQTLRIAKNIPLSRLEWLWTSNGTSLRDSSTAARASFHLSTVKSPPIQSTSNFPHDWYLNPYVFILITSVHQLETGKDAEINRIRAFVNDAREKVYEYLIIVTSTLPELDRNRRLLERIRIEVNTASRGRERMCVVLPSKGTSENRPIVHLHHSQAHQDLLVRLRECVREAAEVRVKKYEAEISRLFLSRSSSEWDFGKFFVMKEGLAFVFLQLGRRDLAIRFYDELQVVMNERDDCSRYEFCNTPGKGAEVAQAVTNPSLKDYRTLLLKNTVTEIELRTYLFSRQLTLLLRDRKFLDIAERGLKYITALARRCADEASNEKSGVTSIFRDTWVFSTSRALASLLAPAIPSPTEADNDMSAQLSSPRERHTARLIAGFHVHAMKAFMGLSHICMPGVITGIMENLPKGIDEMKKEALSTSDQRLNEALRDSKKAEMLHSEISNAAASLYEMGGRPRGAAALDGDAGIIRLRNKSYKEAEKLISAQCSRFINDNGWDDLHKKQRVELARAEKALDRVQEYLVSCLTMLYMSKKSRRRWRMSGPSEKEDLSFAEEAKFWALETSTVAKRLPRIMKYKAERLFDVRVLPNDRMWIEGDSGQATIRVVSDVPSSIEIDSVILECRNSGNSPAKAGKSPSHISNGMLRTHQGNLQNDMNGTSDGNQLISSRFGPDSSQKRCLISLSSTEPVVIKPGTNDIIVHAEEIPSFGTYRITAAAFFIGNLKLVQQASRAPPLPIVTVKGTTDASSSATLSTLNDFARGMVKFPMYFASKRPPSAILSVRQDMELYLAPDITQFVKLRITAGHHGVKKGSRLTCALSNPGPKSSSSRFVSFSDISKEEQELFSKQGLILNVLHGHIESKTYFDVGEAFIDKSLSPNETLDCQIPLRALHDCDQFRDESFDDESDHRCCLLQLQLECIEESGPPGRSFICETEHRLQFNSAVEMTARIEVNGRHFHSPGILALDGTPLKAGGTLICSVRCRTRPGIKVTLLEAQLDLPLWADFRPHEPPAHVDLLPCTIGSRSMFTFIFDILTKETMPGPLSFTEPTPSIKPSNMFDNIAVERRLSRAIASSTAGESEDDIARWTNEKRTQIHVDTFSHLSLVENNLPQNSQSSQGEKGERSPKQTGGEVEKSAVSTVYDAGLEEPESINLREAADVVDLSTPHHVNKTLLTSTSSIESDSLSTFRLQMKIDGLDSVTTFTRKINIQSARGLHKRYRIERCTTESAVNGKPVDFQFTVRRLTHGKDAPNAKGDYDEPEKETLHYEVDADPTVWMVVGRRRGKLNMRPGSSCAGSARLIPVVCGRQRVPCVRLFRQDGRALSLSQYENVNEYMQVVVVPNRNIISSCSVEQFDVKDGRDGQEAANMPVVIASDSFFEN